MKEMLKVSGKVVLACIRSVCGVLFGVTGVTIYLVILMVSALVSLLWAIADIVSDDDSWSQVFKTISKKVLSIVGVDWEKFLTIFE